MNVLESSQTFAQRNATTGLIEIIDCKSGAIVAIQRETFDLFNGHQELLVEHTMPTGEKIKLQKGIDPGLVGRTKAQPFSQVMADLICQKIAGGPGLTSVCKMNGFPEYSTVCRWRRENQRFSEALEQAYRDRAEYLRDLAVAEAEGAESTKDPINAHSLRVDTYKWAAGVDNKRYSPKQDSGSGNVGPVQIIINTGINREEPITLTKVGSHENENVLQRSAKSNTSGQLSSRTAQSEEHPVQIADEKHRDDLGI